MKKYKNFFLIFILVNVTTYSYSQNIVYANLDYILQNSIVGKKLALVQDFPGLTRDLRKFKAFSQTPESAPFQPA